MALKTGFVSLSRSVLKQIDAVIDEGATGRGNHYDRAYARLLIRTIAMNAFWETMPGRPWGMGQWSTTYAELGEHLGLKCPKKVERLVKSVVKKTGLMLLETKDLYGDPNLKASGEVLKRRDKSSKSVVRGIVLTLLYYNELCRSENLNPSGEIAVTRRVNNEAVQEKESNKKSTSFTSVQLEANNTFFGESENLSLNDSQATPEADPQATCTNRPPEATPEAPESKASGLEKEPSRPKADHRPQRHNQPTRIKEPVKQAKQGTSLVSREGMDVMEVLSHLSDVMMRSYVRLFERIGITSFHKTGMDRLWKIHQKHGQTDPLTNSSGIYNALRDLEGSGAKYDSFGTALGVLESRLAKPARSAEAGAQLAG